MAVLVVLFLLFYSAGIYYCPFPYWKTYRLLWHNIIFNRNFKLFHLESRFKQSLFLIKYLIFCPLWTVFWYVDEIFYPDYKNIKLKPVFIMGQPRSGTTFLHRTLASDSDNFVALKHFEWRYPFICLQKILNLFPWAKKIMQRNYWADSPAGNIAGKMHPNKLSDWEEDGIFFEECFLHHFFMFLRFPNPNLLSYFDDFPGLPENFQDHMLNIHGKAIKKVLFLNNGQNKFYLSKEVTSHNKFYKLIKLYPDAKFIFSFRHSSEFISSLKALVRYSTLSKTGIDPLEIPYWESTLIERMEKDCKILLDICCNKVKNENQVSIVFKHFTRNLIPSMEYLYNKFDFEFSSSYRNYLKDLNKRQENRDKGYSYQCSSFDGFKEFDDFVDNKNFEFLSDLTSS